MAVPKLGAWLSDDNTAAAEIVANLGYDFVILDIEHGAFDLAILERFIPFLKALGLQVFAKVLEPARGPIQQALDFGADAVVIPHIENLQHAQEITKFAKFPELGDRSFAGGRTTKYGGFNDDWVAAQDAKTLCFPMVEDAGALEDIDQILKLDTVDGIFIGPSDLSLRRGRGAYTRSVEDFDDLETLAVAANAADKPWMLPAWSKDEKEFAIDKNATYIVLTMQHGALVEGFGNAKKLMDGLVAAP